MKYHRYAEMEKKREGEKDHQNRRLDIVKNSEDFVNSQPQFKFKKLSNIPDFKTG